MGRSVQKNEKPPSPPWWSQSLPEVSVECGAVAQTATAATGEAAVGSVLRSGLGSSGAIEKFVVGHAHVSGGADEDTGAHVGGALGSDDAHAVAAHVDLARHVNDTYGAEGVFTPGVGDLAVGHDGVGVDC
jgi:hypothetical protein